MTIRELCKSVGWEVVGSFNKVVSTKKDGSKYTYLVGAAGTHYFRNCLETKDGKRVYYTPEKH